MVLIQWERDQFVIQLALDGNFNLRLIQQCRLYLRVVTLADIINAEGNKMDKWAYDGPGRTSSLLWPNQGEPSKAAWAEWRKFLNSLLSTYGRMTGRYLQPRYRLGKWRSTHQQWEWRGNNNVVVNKDGRQYKRDGRQLLATPEREIDDRSLYPIDVQEGRGSGVKVWEAGFLRKTMSETLDRYERLRGSQYPTVSMPRFTDVEGDIVIATDGTVKLGKGGAAYVVTSSNVPGTLKGVLPVDGASRHTTSYRTELYGMLGALLTLQTLLQQQGQRWDKLSGILWCDNKAAVKKFNDLEDDKPFSLTIANQTDADVLQELRVAKYKLPVEVTAAWVKGHQTAADTREARLNIIADKIAGEQHSVSGQWAAKQKSDMLPHTTAQLVIDGKRYTGPINKHIQYRMYETKARQYIIDKLGLHRTHGLIDWESLGALHKRLSWKRRATRVKFLF